MKRFFFRIWLAMCVFFLVTEVGYWVYYGTFWGSGTVEYLHRLTGPSYASAASEFAAGDVTVAELSDRFGFPVTEVALATLPEGVRQELLYETGFFSDETSLWMIVGLDRALHFGPFPDYEYGSDIAVSLLITLFFVIAAAFGLRWMMRGTEKELRSLETAAERIAAGKWETRFDEKAGSATRSLARGFNRMAEKTTALIDSQRELLRSTSHELRTPIARLQTAAHILAMTDDKAVRRDRLQALDRDFEQLADLVDELLTYSRFEGALHDAPPPGEFEPARELERVIVQFREDAEARRISLDSESATNGVELAGEARLFRRVMGNLLGNAIRHARGRIEIGTTMTDGDLRIHVDDDGSGIPESEREHVFTPFVRLEPSREPGGHGMGLAIVRRIVERHHGRVWVETAPLGGCRVAFTWPLRG